MTLVGYSEPFDLVPKYGPAWMGGHEPLWDIYYTYIDDGIAFHYLFDESGEMHPYSLIRALKDGWIQFDGPGQPCVNVANLPAESRPVWDAFWRVYNPDEPRPRGRAREIELQFRQITGTTPIDLAENAADLVYFLERGYRVEQLTNASLHRHPRTGVGRSASAPVGRPAGR